MSRAAQAVAAEAAHLILESLRYTREAFQRYPYPSYEIRQERLADVDRAIDAIRSLRKETKQRSK